MEVVIKRIYSKAEPSDGVRVLIDRLWPRGVRKDAAEIDLWLKAAAPSPELRTRWHHDPAGHEPEHFAAFAAAYRDELAEGEARDAVDQLLQLARESARLTLLYGSRNEESNHAMVLREVILQRTGE